jgi:hypothetical protein
MTTLWFYQKVVWNWYHQYARVFDSWHIYYVWWTCFSTECRHTYGYKLCSYSRRLAPLFVRGIHHTGASREKQFSRFGDFVDRVYPIERELKDTTDTYRTASYLDLHLEIDSEGRLRTKHHFESFTVATMKWLTGMEYLCHKWPRICSTRREHFPVLSSFMTYHQVYD